MEAKGRCLMFSNSAFQDSCVKLEQSTDRRERKSAHMVHPLDRELAIVDLEHRA
jgi:hypothetical protein